MFKLMSSTFLQNKISPSPLAVKGASEIGGAPDGLPPSAPYHASRPVSRVLYGAKPTTRALHVTAIPLARRLPGVSSNLPGRPIRTSIRGLLSPCRPYSVLLPVGFAVPPPLPEARCALAAPFHPCRGIFTPRRSAFSVALSLGSPPPDVIRHRMSMEPGLSSPATFRSLPGRPSGRLTA